VRHADIEQDNIGIHFAKEFQRFCTVRGFADNREVGFCFENKTKADADETVIINE
jgi:hypothetical protein